MRGGKTGQGAVLLAAAARCRRMQPAVAHQGKWLCSKACTLAQSQNIRRLQVGMRAAQAPRRSASLPAGWALESRQHQCLTSQRGGCT